VRGSCCTKINADNIMRGVPSRMRLPNTLAGHDDVHDLMAAAFMIAWVYMKHTATNAHSRAPQKI